MLRGPAGAAGPQLLWHAWPPCRAGRMAAAKAFARSLGSAMATGAAASCCGRRGGTPWVGGALRRRGLCVQCAGFSDGRQWGAGLAENDYAVLHSMVNTTTA